MPRRALRKLDPSLDLTGYLKTLADLPRVAVELPECAPIECATAGSSSSVSTPTGPIDFPALFGRVAPIEIEVGSGKGLFLRTAAAARLDHDFLGIEIARRYAEHIAASLARRTLRNARVVAGDAQRLFAEMLVDNSIAAVHVYFPDPWWKARHRKRRMMSEAFLRHVQRMLVPGGELHFWTDVEEYFHTALATIAEVTTLCGPLEVPEAPAEHDFDYRTHFERRMRQHGEAVYRSRFVKALDSK